MSNKNFSIYPSRFSLMRNIWNPRNIMIKYYSKAKAKDNEDTGSGPGMTHRKVSMDEIYVVFCWRVIQFTWKMIKQYLPEFSGESLY